jgi:hypothetical protein
MAAASIFDSASGQEASVQDPWKFSNVVVTREEWGGFSKRLAVVIRDLHKRDFLIISEKTRNVYIQLADGGTLGIRVEAASEQFYPGLQKEDILTLKELGWKSPTYILKPNPGPEPDGSCNYYFDADNMSATALADFVVRTLRDVYETPFFGELKYRAFHDGGREDRHDIEFPALGLEQAQ